MNKPELTIAEQLAEMASALQLQRTDLAPRAQPNAEFADRTSPVSPSVAESLCRGGLDDAIGSRTHRPKFAELWDLGATEKQSPDLPSPE